VHVAAAFVADKQSFEVVQPREGAFDDPAVATETRAVLGLTAGNHRLDAALPKQAAMLVVVVATVGNHALRAPAGSPDSAAHRRHEVDQRDQLGDIIAVAPREGEGERDPGRVDKEMVLRATPASVDRTWAGLGAPFFRLHMAGVDDSSRPLDLAARAQPRKQERVQLLPYTRSGRATANSSATRPPSEAPTIPAEEMSSSSRRLTTSCAWVTGSLSIGVRPKPERSQRSSRYRIANEVHCGSHSRLSAIPSWRKTIAGAAVDLVVQGHPRNLTAKAPACVESRRSHSETGSKSGENPEHWPNRPSSPCVLGGRALAAVDRAPGRGAGVP
jgi:hypothetical protein